MNKNNNNNWLIKNIRIVDGSRCLDEVDVDVLVSGGRIKKIDAPVDRESAGTDSGMLKIDGRGIWLWPGLVDVHVHFRDPGYTHKESFLSGARAAAHGGYTSVLCEPNTDPPFASVEAVREASERAEESGGVRTYFKVAMTHQRLGRRALDCRLLSSLPQVKAVSDDGDPVSCFSLMEAVCKNAASSGLPLSPHCEDSNRSLADYESGVDPGFVPGRPFNNETAYVKRDGALAAKYGCRIHFSHLSLRDSIYAVSRFKQNQALRHKVSCEAAPHHLLLSGRDYPSGCAPAVNPPLRSKEDVEALREALVKGHIDVVASDHAPHSESEKKEGACGLIGLETTLGLILTCFVAPGRLSPLDACRLLSSAPAGIFDLPGGEIKEHSPADLVFIDPGKKWMVDPDKFESLSGNTPFAGRMLTGAAIGTMLNGRLTYSSDELKNRIF